MKYSILHNMNFAAAYPGNFMRSLYDLEKRLREKEIDTVYMLPESARGLYWVDDMVRDGKKVYFKPESAKGMFKVLRSAIRENNIRIVHTHFYTLKDILVIRSFNLLGFKIKTVVHHHNQYKLSNSFLRDFIRRVILSCDAVVGCSDKLADKLIKSGFKKVYSVENAIDFSRFDNIEEKEIAELKGRENVFLMFGYSYYVKGVDIALDAFDILAKKYNICLAVVFATYEKENIALTKEKFGKIPDWMVILPPTDNIGLYYRQSRAFVSSSREEGLCYSIIEAIYCGCQPVISNIPGHQTDVPEIKIFENENAKMLSDKIEQILNEPEEETKRINKIQKEYATKRYDLSVWSKKIEDIYEKLI